ncbi:Uncharacterized protein PPKH_1036 [Pseudomonas putida]|nr:Uncharacterized protein PPKH_1036 [Pseudomonas putida]
MTDWHGILGESGAARRRAAKVVQFNPDHRWCSGRMLAEMPVVRFLFNFVRFCLKAPKNLHKNQVGCGYLSIPVVALRGLAHLEWRIAGSALAPCRTKRRFTHLHADWRGPPDLGAGPITS